MLDCFFRTVCESTPGISDVYFTPILFTPTHINCSRISVRGFELQRRTYFIYLFICLFVFIYFHLLICLFVYSS